MAITRGRTFSDPPDRGFHHGGSGINHRLYLWAAGDAWMEFSLEFIIDRPPAWYFFLPIFWLILLVELYDIQRASNRRETLKGIGLATLIYSLVYLLFYFTSEPNSLPRRGVAFFIVFAAIFTLLWRWIYIRIFTAPHLLRRVLIIGAGKAGETLVQVISEQLPPPFNIIGLIDDTRKNWELKSEISRSWAAARNC